MVRKHSRRRSTRRFAARRGGGLGNSYSFGAPIVPGLGNSAEVTPFSSCLATVRPGMTSLPSSGLGLPGLSGGGKRRSTRKNQKGGRYSFDLSQQIAPGAPWAGAIPQVVRIPCEAAVSNPLNQQGGAGGLGSPFYYAPTAGYSNTASSWVGSTGAPSLIQTPYEARAYNQACLKTGGGKKRKSNNKNKSKKRTRKA